MSDLKLFRTLNGKVSELVGSSVELERSLQTMIESNLEAIFGIRFLASEYTTGRTHSGRLDTLGIDENRCPVILEYKRTLNENVVTQGLFYLDWLLDHKAEFKILVIDKFGREEADRIDWEGTRLLCIAADFTRYDEHAVQQINRNVELLRYRRFGDDLLLFELVNAVVAKVQEVKSTRTEGKRSSDKTVKEALAEMTGPLLDVFEKLRAFLNALGDDVQERHLTLYIAFKRLKNFVCIEIRREKLLLYLRLDPETVDLVPGFSRDVRNIGHWGTGDLEVTVKTDADVDRAQDLILRSYRGS